MTPQAMSPGRLAEITAALQAVPAPPWHWRGDRFSGPMLLTVKGGWVDVMHFRRLGMQGAQPCFPVGPMTGGGLMTDAWELRVPRTEYDTKTFKDIDNPVARWMKNSAQYAAELLAERNRLARALADEADEKTALQGRFDEFRETCASHCADRDVEQVAAEDVELKVKTAREAVDVALLEFADPDVSRMLSSLKAILG